MADIAIILPDGTEDEIEVELCCPTCAGLSSERFARLNERANTGKAINVDDSSVLENTAKFIEFVLK